MKGQINHENGVSETIGFVIIIAIMVTGIGLVTLYGYPLLIQEQTNANVQNMERNMIIIQNDLKSLAYKSVPFKETTLQISGGTLSIKKIPNQNSSFIISYPNSTVISQYHPGELVYKADNEGTFVVLENGAVHVHYWSSPNGSAMIAEPRWFYDPSTHTYTIYLISLNATEDMARDGVGTIRMQITNESQIEYSIPAGTTVEYIADPNNNYNIAWKNYFGSPDLSMTPISSTGFQSKFQLNSTAQYLFIKQYTITFTSL